jgi:hypothetical protein
MMDVFFKLTDFSRLTDPDSWLDEGGGPGTSPFDCSLHGRDMLTGKMLEYWDFLMANAPFYNTVNMDVMDELTGSEFEHNSTANMLALEKILKMRYEKKAKRAVPDGVRSPPKRRRAMLSGLSDAERSAAAAAVVRRRTT